MRFIYPKSARVVFLTTLFICFAQSARSQSAGTFQLDQVVIASGGSSGGGTFTLTDVIGEPIGGKGLSGGRFKINTGFLAIPPLLPTAAPVSISGRVTTPAGIPIGGVRLRLLNSAGAVGSVRTNQFGYFRFDGVAVGETYILTATGKEHEFAPQIISVDTDITDLVLISLN